MLAGSPEVKLMGWLGEAAEEGGAWRPVFAALTTTDLLFYTAVPTLKSEWANPAYTAPLIATRFHLLSLPSDWIGDRDVRLKAGPDDCPLDAGDRGPVGCDFADDADGDEVGDGEPDVPGGDARGPGRLGQGHRLRHLRRLRPRPRGRRPRPLERPRRPPRPPLRRGPLPPPPYPPPPLLPSLPLPSSVGSGLQGRAGRRARPSGATPSRP